MIISLTSFPARIPHIGPSLQSLVSQKGANDRIVLWLGKEKFPNGLADVPEEIKSFSTTSGGAVEFRFTPDLRSFTKLLPALQAFPDETVVTVDDDVIYAPQTFRLLRQAHKRKPDAIFAHAVSDLYRSSGKWKRTTGTFGFFTSPQPLRMMLGIGAVLYPPHCLDIRVTDSTSYQKLCPTNDDIWFWYCAAKKGTPILRVPHAIRRQKGLGKAGTVGALSAINESEGDQVNREYIQRICDADPDFAHRLTSVHRAHWPQIICARLMRLAVHYPRQAFYCLKAGGVGFLTAEVRNWRK